MLLSSKEVPAMHVHAHGAAPAIVSAAHCLDVARKVVSDFEADAYVIVSQPGLHASDFSAASAQHATANLRRLFDSAPSSYAVRNAHGAFDVDSLERHIVDTWGTDTIVIDAAADAFLMPEEESSSAKLLRVEFPVLPVDYSRSAALAENDAFLHSVLSLLRSDNYAVFYTSSPIAAPATPVSKRGYVYDPSNTTESYYPTGTFGYPTGSATATSTVIPEGARTDGSIFTRYQFFTAGMFMSIIASVVLLIILGVALKSIASIKISYEAFEKEMGPQTLMPQKK
ncbi:BIG/ATPase V1 complex, subunit S1 [Limtongia smithiae]|uniref:BIG/ATPase V1 complex, subunit S1 n=1 Tax=Limtongia smithiae TaxID=1125753 RepID=UPI0034CF271C